MDAERTEEQHESLWWLTVSPTIWLAHFLASYITVAIFCAKLAGREGSLGPARVAIAVYTAIALAGIVATGLRGLRCHGFETATIPHDFDTKKSRHAFLGFAVVLLSGLSFVATVYVALPALFYGSCR